MKGLVGCKSWRRKKIKSIPVRNLTVHVMCTVRFLTGMDFSCELDRLSGVMLCHVIPVGRGDGPFTFGAV